MLYELIIVALAVVLYAPPDVYMPEFMYACTYLFICLCMYVFMYVFIIDEFVHVVCSFSFTLVFRVVRRCVRVYLHICWIVSQLSHRYAAPRIGLRVAFAY